MKQGQYLLGVQCVDEKRKFSAMCFWGFINVGRRNFLIVPGGWQERVLGSVGRGRGGGGGASLLDLLGFENVCSWPFGQRVYSSIFVEVAEKKWSSSRVVLMGKSNVEKVT